jgi:hypothetical protein
LFLGTPKDNMHDKERKGRGSKPPTFFGEEHHNSKCSNNDVEKIKSDTRVLRVIASEYGLSVKTIWRIKKGLTRGSNNGHSKN